VVHSVSLSYYFQHTESLQAMPMNRPNLCITFRNDNGRSFHGTLF
jgi:hypothetical protein